MTIDNNAEKDVLEKKPALKEEVVTERDILKFAQIILLFIAFIFIFGGIAELIEPNNGIFEACKTILPPIATLVIGFYFGKNN